MCIHTQLTVRLAGPPIRRLQKGPQLRLLVHTWASVPREVKEACGGCEALESVSSAGEADQHDEPTAAGNWIKKNAVNGCIEAGKKG